MKTTRLFIIIVLTLSALGACTQNEGNIGYLFGIWRLHEITDETHTETCDTVFLAFQSDVFQLRRVIYDIHEYSIFTGLYTRDDTCIHFRFLNHNGTDVTTDSLRTDMLNDLKNLHIDTPSPSFRVVSIDNHDMVLQYNGYSYSFVKL